MAEGWIKLHRKISEWEWSTKPLTLALFVYILTNASHKPNAFRGKKYPEGTLITGRKKMSLETGLSEQQVRTALNHLKSTSDITIQSTNEYSIISITNWKKYQSTNQPSTNEQPTDNQRVTTIQECKNVRMEEVKKEYMYFPEFWELYPRQRRGNKDKAEKAYRKAADRDSEGSIIAGLRDYCDSEEVSKGFAKGAEAWLNDDRWKNNYTKGTKNAPTDELAQFLGSGRNRPTSESSDLCLQKPKDVFAAS